VYNGISASGADRPGEEEENRCRSKQCTLFEEDRRWPIREFVTANVFPAFDAGAAIYSAIRSVIAVGRASGKIAREVRSLEELG